MLIKSYNSPIIGSFGVNIKINKKILSTILPEAKSHRPVINAAANGNITSLLCVPWCLAFLPFIEALLFSTQGSSFKVLGQEIYLLLGKNWLELFERALDRQIQLLFQHNVNQEQLISIYMKMEDVFAALGNFALDMTFEAASVKLMIMLGTKYSFDKRHAFLLHH